MKRTDFSPFKETCPFSFFLATLQRFACFLSFPAFRGSRGQSGCSVGITKEKTKLPVQASYFNEISAPHAHLLDSI